MITSARITATDILPQSLAFPSETRGNANYPVWVLVERDTPHIIGRRRTSPEMLAAGRTALATLMAAYAKCVATGLWPAFDPLVPQSEDSWSPFHLEAWMTQGTGGAQSFFGVSAAPALPESN
jgi:hypothetical protein